VQLDPSRGPLRSLRAGVFTAVAVLLAVIGHSSAADTSSAALLWLLGAVPVVFAVAWLLAARRRQIPLVLAGSVGVQCALHLLMSRTSGAAPVSLEAFWCHTTRPLSQLPAGTTLAGWHPHGGVSPWHMLAAHLLAAAAAGVWMARGDRALESLLRLLTVASSALGITRPTTIVSTPCPTSLDVRSGWLPAWHPRHLQLVRVSVARRGPPAYAC
jgi:hypothetical protein